jgi:phosphoribosylformylglycinamidine synthase
MPHPERTYKGDPVFKSLNNFLNSDDVFSYKALRYESKKITISPFEKPKKRRSF